MRESVNCVLTDMTAKCKNMREKKGALQEWGEQQHAQSVFLLLRASHRWPWQTTPFSLNACLSLSLALCLSELTAESAEQAILFKRLSLTDKPVPEAAWWSQHSPSPKTSCHPNGAL